MRRPKGNRWGAMRLTATGRRTGRRRSVIVGYFEDGPNLVGDRTPDQDDIADLRGVLYGLHASLRLHTVQEDETYLSLGDSTDAVTA